MLIMLVIIARRAVFVQSFLAVFAATEWSQDLGFYCITSLVKLSEVAANHKV
jgi:hypothetical protein